jgi:ABC-2 type transport system permease protein
VSLDAKRIRIALLVEQTSPETAAFSAEFFRSEYFRPVLFSQQPAAEQALLAGEVQGIVTLKADFARQLQLGKAPIQLLVNGVDANTGRLMEGYLQGVWRGWLAHRAALAGEELKAPVRVESRVWFNSELRSRNFLVPGLIAIIMTLTGALLTAMVVAREWERGTMEALMVTPATAGELLIGKLVPYFMLGMGSMAVSVAMAVWLFKVPLVGSLWVLSGAAALFLLVALAMGLLISSVTRNQFAAGQVALLSTFLPAFILSGFLFYIDSMPQVVRLLTYLVAARYFVAILQTVFLAGDVWSVVLPNALALALMAALLLALTRRAGRKRLR